MEEAKSPKEQFLELYREFEGWAYEHYNKEERKERDGQNKSLMVFLENFDSLAAYNKPLSFYRQVRNLLSHYEVLGDSHVKDMLVVTDKMVDEFREFKKIITSPAKESQLTVPVDEFTKFSLTDKVQPAIKFMSRHDFTHAPIIENGKVIGLFGEKCLFDYISKGNTIDSETTFEQIQDHTRIWNWMNIACSRKDDLTVPDCRYVFQKALQDNKRCDIIFFTEDGTFDSPVTALTTIWDLPAEM